MTERNFQVLHDDGDLAVVTVTDLNSTGHELGGQVTDAILDQFADDDAITVKEPGGDGGD